MERLKRQAREGDTKALAELSRLQCRKGYAQEHAQQYLAILEGVPGPGNNPKLQALQEVASGGVCKHRFCMSDDQTQCLECSICGANLGRLDPYLRYGDVLHFERVTEET